MNLAVAALENPPVGAGVAEVAVPLDEGAVGLDHLEDVGAAGCEGHGCRLLVRCGNGVLVVFLREAVRTCDGGPGEGVQMEGMTKRAKKRDKTVWHGLVTARRQVDQGDAPTELDDESDQVT